MSTPSRGLVIAAHPDDADSGAGGLIATCTAAGCEVTVLCVTDGDSAGFDGEHGLAAGLLTEAFRVVETG